jgi:hypothetical protein
VGNALNLIRANSARPDQGLKTGSRLPAGRTPSHTAEKIGNQQSEFRLSRDVRRVLLGVNPVGPNRLYLRESRRLALGGALRDEFEYLADSTYGDHQQP